MQWPRKRRRGVREAIAPLVDIVFLLLIFFLLASTLRSPELLPVELPGSRAGSPSQADARVVWLDRNGQLGLDEERLDRDGLIARLSARSESRVLLRADADAPARALLPLLESLQEAGIDQVELVTRRER